MSLCFISLLIYYIKPVNNCYNNKYDMYYLDDNLVLAVPLHSIALGGQPASLHTAPTISISIISILISLLHAALQVALS